MIQKKITDGSAAEDVVKRHMEAQYADKLRNVYFRKAWLSSAAIQQFWEVEGTVVWKKGLLSKEKRNFRFQIDPEQGNIIGKEEFVPK